MKLSDETIIERAIREFCRTSPGFPCLSITDMAASVAAALHSQAGTVWSDDAFAGLRRSREIVVCCDPDQIRLINRVLDLIEGLHRRIERLERS